MEVRTEMRIAQPILVGFYEKRLFKSFFSMIFLAGANLSKNTSEPKPFFI
jgi:hypothetical protein